MSNVINLAKRRSWRGLKRFIEGGKVLLPPSLEYQPRSQISDAGLALAYALSALNQPQPPSANDAIVMMREEVDAGFD